MKKLLLAVGVASVITGCASDGSAGSVNNTIEFTPSVVNREFTVKKMGNINKASITQSLGRSMNHVSHIPQARLHVYREKKNRDTKDYWVGGLGISPSDSGLDLVYSANSINKLDNNTYYYETVHVDERRAKFGVDIADSKDAYKVTLTCPTSYTDYDQFRGGVLFEEYQNQYPPIAVTNDLNNLCENSSISIGQVELVEGEFNTKFKPDGVYANFERILGANSSVTRNLSHVKTFDINKAQTFKFKLDNGSTELGINVYPYRGGSKVLYAYNYRYQVNGDNETSYSTSQLKKVREQIIKIAND